MFALLGGPGESDGVQMLAQGVSGFTKGQVDDVHSASGLFDARRVSAHGLLREPGEICLLRRFG